MAGLKVFDGFSWRAVGVEDSFWDVLTATARSFSVELSWPTAGGLPTSYELDIDGTIIDVGNTTSYERVGLTPNQQYTFKVRPKYSDGSTGGWSYFKNRTPTGFNSATGGTTTEVSNYNGTGQTWRVHTFTSNGTFSISSSGEPFSVLLVAGGGGGGDSQWFTMCGGGGGAGGLIYDSSKILSSENYSITIGSGGALGSNTGVGVGGDGGNTSAFGLTAIGGGGGGGRPSGTGGAGVNGRPGGSGGGAVSQDSAATGGAGTPGQGNNGGSSSGTGNAGGGGGAGGAGTATTGQGGPGLSYSITGSSVTYAVGGGGKRVGNAPVANTGSGGRGSTLESGTNAENGADGIVIVSYRIA